MITLLCLIPLFGVLFALGVFAGDDPRSGTHPTLRPFGPPGR